MTPTANAPAEPKAIVYPYPGLRAFNTDEAEIFFGRTDHVDDLLLRLKSKRFLGIVGPSGCGKSSLIRAGVIPALHAGLVGGAGCDWQVAVMRPGTQPLKNLSNALQASGGPCGKPFAEEGGFLDAVLRRGPMGLIDALTEYQCDQETNLLLLVDQFEELFRFERESDGSEAQAFVELLLASARSSRIPVYVILTMRSHFLGRCPIFRGLPEALNDSQYLTPRLNRDEQRQAIEGPAQMFNTTVRPEVVNRILNEMGSDPDQLPLMQHLLMRMWRKEQLKAKNHSTPIELTLETYKEVGGLSGCVLIHAEAIYERLQEGDRRIAELMWRRLTDVTSDGALTRRECEFDTLCRDLLPAGNASDVNALRRVIEEFRQSGRSFLMPPPPEPLSEKTPIDVSHESIIRQWKRLRDWAYDEHMITRTRRNVGERVKRWKTDPKNMGYLLSGVDLAEAKIWQRKYPHQLSPDEAALLKESITKEEADVRKEEELKYSASLKTKNHWLKGLVFAAIALAGGAGVLAWQNDKIADLAKDNETKATTNLKKFKDESEFNRAERLANASINTRTKPQLRLLLALEARHGAGVGKSPVVEDAFFKALSAFDRFGITSRALPGHRMRVTSMTRVDQQWLLTGSEDETVRLWDLDPKNMSSILLPGQAAKVSVVAAHPSGRWAAAGSVDGTLRLWNIEDRKKPALVICFHAHISRLTDIEFSAGQSDGKFEVHWLVTAAEDGSVCRWDLRDPAKIVASATSLAGNTEGVLDIAIASDGATLATGSKDGIVRILDLQPNKPKDFPLPAKAHSNWVKDVALSADNQWLATGSLDRTVKFWNLDDIRNGIRRPPTTLMLGAPVRVVTFTNNKKVKENLWLAVGDDYGQVRFYKVKPNMESPQELPKLDFKGGYQGKGLVRAITFDEENQWVASVHEGSPVIWVHRFNPDRDASPIDTPIQLVGHEGDVTQLVFRMDPTVGKAPLLVSAGLDGIVRQWDLNKDNWALSVDETRLLAIGGLPAADWIEKGRFLFMAKTNEAVTFWPYDQTKAKPIGDPLKLTVPLKAADPVKVAQPVKVAEPATLKEKHAVAGQYLAVALLDHNREFYLARLDSKDKQKFKSFEGLHSTPTNPDSINGIALNRAGAGAAEKYHLAIVTKHQLLVWSFTGDFLKDENAQLTELVQACGADFTPDELHDVRLSGDGKWAACRSGGRLLLCPIEKGATFEKLSLGNDAQSSTWRGGDSIVNQAKFSALMFNRVRPGGKRWFAAGDDQGQVFLYDLDKGAANVIPRRLQGLKQPVTSLRFSANDHWLAALSAEGVSVWDLSVTGKTVPTEFRIKAPQVTKFAFDPLERSIITGHVNGLLMQWNLASLKKDEQPSPMRCFDGRFGAEFDTFPRRDIVALNFEDNNAFIAISAEGAVRRWRLAANPDVSNDELWRRIGRGLTELEWNDPLNKVAGDKPFVRGIEKQVLAALVQESPKPTEFEASVTELIALVNDDPHANLARFAEEVKLAAAPRIVNKVIDRAKDGAPKKADEDLMRRAAELTSRYQVNEDRVLGTLKWMGKHADVRKQIQLFYRAADEKKVASALNIFENDLQKSLTDGDAESQKIKRIAVEAHAKLANELVKSAKLAEAKAHLAKAQTLDQHQPAPEKTFADLQRKHSSEFLSNANEQMKNGNANAALEAYRHAREIDPGIAESPEAYFQRFHVEHLIGKALDASGKGDLANAEATYREAQKLDPSYRDVDATVFVHGARARALVMDARREIEKKINRLINAKEASVSDLKFDVALGKLKQAAELDGKLPLAPEPFLNILVGRNLLLTGRELGLRNDARMKAALVEADKRLQAASLPDFAKRKIEDPEGLFERYAFVIGKFPAFHDKTHPTAISKRVEKLVKDGMFSEAAALIERLREIDPLTEPDATCWKNLCWFGCLHDPKNLKRYATAGEMAVLLQPDNGEFRDARGLARALAGDHLGAIDDFRAFVNWTPNQRKRQLRMTLIDELKLAHDQKKNAAVVFTDRRKLELQGIIFRTPPASALTIKSERDPSNKSAYRNIHDVRLQAGQRYSVRQVGPLMPVLRLEDSKGRALAEYDGSAQISFVRHLTGDYRIVVSSPYANATGVYQFDLREVGDDELPFDQTARLAPTDPFDTNRAGCHRKVFELELMAGAVYTIQMDSSEFDPFLRLEDSTGQQVAFNDDSGDGLNARIDYTPPETGLYRVICTSFIKGATGQFRLLVSEKD